MPAESQQQPAPAATELSRVAAGVRRSGRVARRLAPWAISLLVHVGVAAALMFALMLVADDGPIIIPDAHLADFPGSPLTASRLRPEIRPLTDPSVAPEVQLPREPAEPVLDDLDESDQDLIIAAVGDAALGELEFGADVAAATPRSDLYGTGGTARHIVYVVDCSGSMDNALGTVASPGPVRWELIRSVSELQPVQKFQLIFFTTGEPRRFPAVGLIPATDDAKRKAARFMRTIRPDVETDPIPALTRAFEVLDRIGRVPGGKLIYLLTDGFELDADSVLSALRTLNRRGDVRICVVMYDELPAPAKGDSWLRRIADEHGGQFQRIIAED